MTRKRKVKGMAAVLSAVICFGSLCLPAYGREGFWEKDGKYWKYVYSPYECAEDEWIEVDGKEYYIDTKGHMKTGWLRDKDDGKRYYLGDDGAKRYNEFTSDDKYVGPDGTVLSKFDSYRKVMKKQLQSEMKSKWYQELSAGQEPEFLLIDLNEDEYRDVVIFKRSASAQQLLLAAVWDPEQKKMILSAEGDIDGTGNFKLSYDAEEQKTWLRITESDGSINYFAMEHFGTEFESKWAFKTEKDDWGDLKYYVEDCLVDEEEYMDTLDRAEKSSGTEITDGYLVLNEENVLKAVDKNPTEEELHLWE